MKMVNGFMGKTHALLSVMLFSLCMLIPVDFFQNIYTAIKENILFTIVLFIVLIGGALLPDLDNSQSCAGSTLGAVGGIYTVFMQSTSHIIWNLMHLRGDRPPINQHRYFWHTLVAGGGILSAFYFLIPDSEFTIIEIIKRDGIEHNVGLIFLIMTVFIGVLVGSDMVLSRFIKLFKLPKILNYILPVLMIVYLFFIDVSHIHILGICLGMGYIFHCIEDFFADSGVPLLFPIPIKKQFWHRCRFLITCETGSLTNTILDIVFLAIDIGLLFLIYIRR